MDITGTAGIGSSKMKELVNGLKSTVPRGEKSIVFSMFDSALLMAEAAITDAGMGDNIVRFYSGMNSNARDAAIQEFNDNPSKTILLITYGCGARGLNLTVANWVCTWIDGGAPNADDQMCVDVIAWPNSNSA